MVSERQATVWHVLRVIDRLNLAHIIPILFLLCVYGSTFLLYYKLAGTHDFKM